MHRHSNLKGIRIRGGEEKVQRKMRRKMSQRGVEQRMRREMLQRGVEQRETRWLGCFIVDIKFT
jgi:hypothetical protein